MTSHLDKQITRALREQAPQPDAPDFEVMWRRASDARDDQARPTPRRRAPIAIACAAAALLAAWWLIPAPPAHQPAVPARTAQLALSVAAEAPTPTPDEPLELFDEAAAWDAPTDFLLAEGSLWEEDEAWDALWDETIDGQL